MKLVEDALRVRGTIEQRCGWKRVAMGPRKRVDDEHCGDYDEGGEFSVHTGDKACQSRCSDRVWSLGAGPNMTRHNRNKPCCPRSLRTKVELM